MARVETTTPPSTLHLPGIAPCSAAIGGPYSKPSKLIVADVIANNTPHALVHEIYSLRHRVAELESAILELPLSPPSSAATTPSVNNPSADPVLLVQSTLSSTSSQVPTSKLPLQFRPTPPLPEGYVITSSPELHYLHFAELFSFLTTHPEIYWAQDRTKEAFARQLQRSWRSVFVVKTSKKGKDELAGFCRVISDGEDFAYLADVVILPAHRRKGLARLMIQDAIENSAKGRDCSRPSGEWKWFLWTKDAHPLYHAAGFHTLPTNGRAMERYPNHPPA